MGLFSGFEHIVREGEPLAPYTWFRLGGQAQYFAEPTSVDELAKLVKRAGEAGVPARLLGGGSNVLVRDEGVQGLILHLTAAAFGNISTQNRKLTVGGGAKLGHVVSTAVREGFAGLEQLVGIPGTVGGALRTNAGSHAGDIGQYTTSATVMTKKGEIVTRRREDLRFGYRASSLDELVILEATFEAEAGDPVLLTKHMQQLWILKKANQPLTDQATGCMFKSPGGMNAENLIDEAGLKGTRVGEAEVSQRNANFIVVGSKAKSRDVIELIERVRRAVADRTGVELEPCLEIW
jgi:UDP-N-acetylmuramate dehydrogenase